MNSQKTKDGQTLVNWGGLEELCLGDDCTNLGFTVW